MNLKRTVSEAVIVGALVSAAVGTGAGGVATAAPITPSIPGVTLPQDGHGHGWNGDDDGGGNWNGPWYGPGYWGGRGFVSACINASGPWGYLNGSICI